MDSVRGSWRDLTPLLPIILPHIVSTRVNFAAICSLQTAQIPVLLHHLRWVFLQIFIDFRVNYLVTIIVGDGQLFGLHEFSCRRQSWLHVASYLLYLRESHLVLQKEI